MKDFRQTKEYKQELLEAVQVIDHLSEIHDEEKRQSVLCRLKEVKGIHSDKWSQVFDILDEYQLDTSDTTKIVEMIEAGCLISLTNILW